MKKTIALCMAIMLLAGITACAEKSPSTTIVSDSPTAVAQTYENTNLGFSLQFPASWTGRYVISEGVRGIAVYSKAVRDKYDLGLGALFSVSRQTGELITQEDMNHGPVPQELLLQGNGYTYYMMAISDVQAPLSDENLSGEYYDLYEHISDVYRSIALLGDVRPQAEHEGYKVVGTSFFTTEIPETWYLRTREDALLTWNIYDGDNYMGNIAMLARDEVMPDEAGTQQSRLLQQMELFRYAAISLQTDDESVMDAMSGSFIIGSGNPNIIDLKTEAASYIRSGGEKLFGQIERVDMQDGRPFALTVTIINVDGTDGINTDKADTYEKTFVLENHGPIVAPLTAPNYKALGTYERYGLTDEFFDAYPNYTDFYYDFITDSAGTVQIVLGHYLP